VAESRTPQSAARVWGPVGWTVWALGVVCGTLASLLAAFVVTWKAEPSCGNLATTANVRAGLTGLGIAAVLLASPWVLTVCLASKRWRPLVVGLTLTLLPLAVVAATHSQAADWNDGGFCF
jgi:hypothetical protein